MMKLTRRADGCVANSCCFWLLAALLLSLGGNLANAQDDDAAKVGLQKFLPEEPPSELTEQYEIEQALSGKGAEEEAKISEDVTKLAEQIATQVQSLYFDSLSVDEQRSLLESLDTTANDLSTRGRSGNAGSTKATDLAGRLSRLVQVGKAVFKAIDQHSNAEAGPAYQEVLAFEEWLADKSTEQMWLSYLNIDDLKQATRNSQLTDDDKAIIRDIADRIDLSAANTEELKEFMAKPAFDNLRAALDMVLDDSIEGDPRFDEQMKRLIFAVETYERSNGLEYLEEEDELFEVQGNTVVASRKLRQSLDRLRASYPSASSPLTAAINRYYFNYNVRMIADEALLKLIIEDERRECGPVRDCILGARVYGQQVTDSTISFDLLPSSNGVSFQLAVDGQVKANTTGYAEKATVYTTSRHYFRTTKGIHFDGNRFSTEPATISVNANNYPYKARVNFRLLFPRLLDSIALDKAKEKKPQTEAIARQRVSSRVLPKFNGATDSQFAEASDAVQNKLYARLTEADVMPDDLRFSSSSNRLNVNARLMDSAEVGATRPPKGLSAPAGGVMIQIHESWMNNAARELNLDGRTLDEKQLQELIETEMKQLLGDDFELKSEPNPDADGTKFAFAKSDALRFEIEDGKINLIVRTGLERGEEGSIGPRRLRVPFFVEIMDDELVIKRTPGIEEASPLPTDDPAELEKGRVLKIAETNVLRQKLDSSLPGSEQDNGIVRERSRMIDLEFQEKIYRLKIQRIVAADGWLTILVK